MVGAAGTSLSAQVKYRSGSKIKDSGMRDTPVFLGGL